MKGLQPLQWAYIVLTISLLIIVFAINPLQAALDTAIANNAELTAEKLRAAIDIMQTMPSRAEHTMSIYAKKCKIYVDQKSVTVEIKTNITLNLIQTSNTIVPPVVPIDCEERRTITIQRIGNTIRII